jgi:hypothetical protein
MGLAIENNRACSRKQIDLEITLIAQEGIPSHGTLKNISFSGAYVLTHSRVLQPNTPLTIVLQQDEGDIKRIYRMNATVARRDRTGAGIVFDDFDNDTIRSLRMIYKSTLD